MLRTFPTHTVRSHNEICGLWDFTPRDMEKNETRRVMVPSCWESYPGLESYRGTAVYETVFTAGGNLRVLLEGVSHSAKVYLDDVCIARHYNAYTAFSGILPGAAKGRHRLKIEVDNSFSENSALHIPNDYMTYGGINRPIAVEEVPDTYLEWVHAVPVYRAGFWYLKAEALVKNIGRQEQTVQLVCSIAGQEFSFEHHTVSPGEEIIFQQELAVGNVREWSPESPVLYTIHALLFLKDRENPIDDLIERTGFREVRVDGKNILLNGAPLRIKGFCRHEDHPHFGCALPVPVMDLDLNILADLGVNAVRTAHYPNDQRFLDLCDEKGILVWEENHARGLSEEQMRNPNFERQCADCIREMIDCHFNHPSIVIWGILNECASETEYGKSCYRRQFQQIKEMDTSRPTSFASCKFHEDISLDLPDIVSFNIYPLWYHDTPPAQYLSQLYKWIQQQTAGAGKPFLITEIGAGAIYGNRSHISAKWSEERQADILRQQIKAVLEFAECSGVFLWQFCDVRISEEWFHTRPRCMNNKGVVDEYRRPKLSYDVVKELYHHL